MNIFATLHEVDTFTFKQVKYYSVQFEDHEIDEFLDFLNRMEDIKEIEEDLNIFIAWLEEIGERHGALKEFFRHEGKADALPPPAKKMRLNELEVTENIHLYCLRANEHVVFLFNGGIKTTNKAQDCPNVSTYFRQANQLAGAIEKLFINKDIRWNTNQTDILFEPNLEIEI